MDLWKSSIRKFHSGWGKHLIQKDLNCLSYFKNTTFNTPVAGTFSFYPGLQRYFCWRQKNPDSSLPFSTTWCIQDPRSCQNRWKLFSITLRQNQYNPQPINMVYCCLLWTTLSSTACAQYLTGSDQTNNRSGKVDYESKCWLYFCTVQPVINSTHFN